MHPDIRWDEKSLWIGAERVQIISGAFHYFRVPRAEWRDRLEKCRHGGLNTIETIVPWNIHEYREGEFDWSGNRDLAGFLDLCHELGFYTIVRPSPYICGEWDNGGIPAWLSVKKRIGYRRSNAVYLAFVARWYDTLMPLIATRQWKQGGSVILVQIENEYGYFHDAQDVSYMEFLRDAMVQRGIIVPLLTCDWPGVGFLVDGAVKGANFGSDFRTGLAVLKKEQPKAFAFVSELWLAWFDHWGGSHHIRKGRDVANALKEVLAAGGHYNFYMWAGGTNFGYDAGRTTTGPFGAFITTSYDYDAPIGETGNITEKFYECRLVNWLANTMKDLFAASVEIASTWYSSNPNVDILMRQSPSGQVLYLRNLSDSEQRVHICTAEGEQWPTSDDIVVQGKNTMILLMNCQLNQHVLLKACSAEVLGYVPDPNRPALLVYGEKGEACELTLNIDNQMHQVQDHFPTDSRKSVVSLPGIDIVLLPRDLACVTWIEGNRDGWSWRIDPSYAQRTTYLLPDSFEWKEADVIHQLAERSSSDAPLLLPLEHFGIYQGYGWYRTTFTHDGGKAELVLTDVHDRAIVFVNGERQGVIGSFAAFARIPIRTHAGNNELLILMDALGRYTFTSRIGEQKGLLGAAYLGGRTEDMGKWTHVADKPDSWEMQIPWCDAQGLLLRLAGKGDNPLQLGINEMLLHAHRSIGDDDEFLEIDVTPYLRPGGNTLWLQCESDENKLPSVSGVRYDITAQLIGPWQVYEGIVGEDTKVTIDPTSFDQLKWKPCLQSDGKTDATVSHPKLFATNFELPAISDDALSLKILMDTMSKGVVWLNGHHLGRYWNVGPQRGLYAPREWIKAQNTLIVFDEDGQPPHGIRFLLEDCFI